jgi:hypothetical protein
MSNAVGPPGSYVVTTTISSVVNVNPLSFPVEPAFNWILHRGKAEPFPGQNVFRRFAG